jgi:2-phosphosulfolactate phosphatase
MLILKIIRKSCAKGAEEAEGLTVIIDVFRAFSCAPLFFHFGAKRVILKADPEKALAVKRENPEFILVGEINEVPMKGADFGNSPSQIIQKGESYFKDKTVVHRTTAGVTGVSSAYDKADEIILGSFVMAKAIAAYIKRKNPDQVTLVAMGDRAQRKSPEDETCADYLEYLLAGRPYNPVKAFKDIVFQQTAQKFIQGTKEYLPKEDPIFCLQHDLFDFILTAKRLGDQLEVFKQVP